MDPRELDETIRLLEGFKENLGVVFKKVIASYGGRAPSVEAVHDAQVAIAEAIGELDRLRRHPRAES